VTPQQNAFRLHFGIYFALQPPWRSGFQPGLNDASDLHALKNIGDWVHYKAPFWTARKIISTPAKVKLAVTHI
jgi:hypothetical protein